MSTAVLLLSLLGLAVPPGDVVVQARQLGDSVIQARQLGGLEARAAALMLSGQNGGGLPLEGLVVPVAEAEEGVRLVLVLDIGGVEPGGEEPRLYEVYAYVLESGDRVSAFLSQGFLLDPEQGGRRIKFFGELRLVPGEYSLRLFVRRRGDESFALRTVPLRVDPFGSPEAPPRPSLAALSAEEWVVVLDETAGGELPFLVDGQPAAPFEPPPQADTAEAVETTTQAPPSDLRLVPGYVAALRRLAGGAKGAREELVAVERAAMTEANGPPQEIIRARLLKLADKLAALDPESLVPWIALYDELYREHHGRSDFLMSTHDREMLVAVSDLYVRRAGPEKAGPLVACALVSLGGYLLDIGSAPTAQAPIEAALEHDPNQVGALGLLAELYEARGDYKGAAELQQRITELEPGNGEARLRLAINLGRLGEAAAEDLLTGSLSAEEVWVAVLAHQELARLYLAQDRTAEATALLEKALEKWPDSQRLHLQLAAALDRAGRPAAAAEVLAKLDPTKGREEPTPRLLYSSWPTEPAEKARRTLAAAGEERRTALAVALDKLREGGP